MGDTSELTSGTQAGTVLVADDDDLVRMVLTDMLEELGYSVLTAANSDETIETFSGNAERIRFVILDYKMPGLSGGETFDRLKEADPEVKVLLSSGHSDTIDLDKLRERGLLGFLPKPYSLARIRQKIAEIIG